MKTNNYSTVIFDIGSGEAKTGFGGEDGPRNTVNSLVGIPKMSGCMVGMEKIEK